MMSMRQQEADYREDGDHDAGNGVGNPEATVVGPTGKPLTRADLPPPGITRWVIRRKAEVVAGVRGGLISLDEALCIYDLSEDEFRSWQRLLDDHGMAGLRATNLKKYRRPVIDRPPPRRPRQANHPANR